MKVIVVRLLVVALCIVSAFAAYAILAALVLHGPVTARSLAVSVGNEAGAVGTLGVTDFCKHTGRLSWRCQVADREGSGGAVYRVRVQSASSCWTGVLTVDDSEGTPMSKSLSGCVRRWQWW